MLASIAAISNFLDINEINKNIFDSFNLPKGRGNILQIKLKKILFIYLMKVTTPIQHHLNLLLIILII